MRVSAVVKQNDKKKRQVESATSLPLCGSPLSGVSFAAVPKVKEREREIEVSFPTCARFFLFFFLQVETHLVCAEHVSRESECVNRDTHIPPTFALFAGGGPRGCALLAVGYDHTWLKAPHPVRFVKLSSHRLN